MSEPSPNLYEFQPFVFRKDTGTLERNGYAIRLNDQMAKVLGEFVEHPGELIGRQQLSHLLWPDGVFTESELGINKIISKLRISLRDDPKKPRYIETIPKRGYRFLAKVTKAPVTVVPVEVPAPSPVAELKMNTRMTAEPKPSGWGRWVLWGALAAALLLGAVGIVWRLRSRPSTAVAATPFSLAVAPFEVKDSDPTGSQLAESFRLDLVDSLSQMPGLSVRAAHSVNARTTDAQGRAEPQKLDVTGILYTEFTRSGDTYTLQMELVRNSDSAHLDGWHYSGTVAQLGSIREQAQADIFSYCTGSGSAGKATVGSTKSPAAYELYLRARYHFRQLDDDSLRRSQSEYRAAIERDPGFAKAYSGLARATFQVAATDKDYKQAEALAGKALEIAPDVAEAHAVLGYLYFRHEWRFADGEREERRAIALEPHESNYHIWLSLMLAKLGRYQESMDEIAVARRDDPYWVQVLEGEVYVDLSTHQFDRAMQPVEEIVELKPEWPDSYHERAWVNWIGGRYPQAIADWRRVATMRGANDRVAFEDRGLRAFQAGGERAYARLRMEKALEDAARGDQDADFVPAEWAAYAGDYQTSLKQLTLVVDHREREATNLTANPAYVPMHHDPRFQALLERVGLPLPNDVGLAR